MKNAPKLTKNKAHPHDFRELSFGDYILIQNKAQEVANNIGYPVYLVGSAIHTHLPRDIDISVVIPYMEYIERYNINEVKDLPGTWMATAWYKDFENINPLIMLQFKDYKIDFKICPNNWYEDNERVLLAKPQSKGDKNG